MFQTTDNVSRASLARKVVSALALALLPVLSVFIILVFIICVGEPDPANRALQLSLSGLRPCRMDVCIVFAFSLHRLAVISLSEREPPTAADPTAEHRFWSLGHRRFTDPFEP